MPPKTKVKEEVREKVREIRLRQQNWLKQRADSIDNKSSKSCDASEGVSRTKPANLSNKAQAVSHTSQYNRGKNGTRHMPASSGASPQESGSRSGLPVGMGSQSHHGPKYEPELSKQPGPAKYNASHYSTRPLGQTFQYDHHDDGHHGDDADYARDDTPSPESSVALSIRSSESSASVLSPDQFDNLADQIVARVKKDLHLNAPHSGQGQEPPSPVKVAVYTQKSGRPMNHLCSACQEVMSGSVHAPMMAIPCGHTICRSCVKRQGSTCYDCSCSVSSFTCNIMLQQIISDFQPSSTTQADYQRFSHKDQVSGGHSTRDYEDELHSLSIRLEALEEERSVVAGSVDAIDAKITKEQRLIENVEREESRVQTEIESLREKLGHLQRHREGFQQTCHKLSNQKLEESKRLRLVEESLTQLQKDMDKIQMLAGRGDS